VPVSFSFHPTAYAVSCIFMPLRGCHNEWYGLNISLHADRYFAISLRRV
jgi:hypothetical protein